MRFAREWNGLADPVFLADHQHPLLQALWLGAGWLAELGRGHRLMLLCGHLAIRSGHSVVETLCPPAVDQAVVAALRQRFSSVASSYAARPNVERS